jgi:hypothetical protein
VIIKTWRAILPECSKSNYKVLFYFLRVMDDDDDDAAAVADVDPSGERRKE